MTTNAIPSSAQGQASGRLARVGETWRRARPHVRDFFIHTLGQVRILKKAYPGLMHALIFWGVTIQVFGTAINLMQMQLFIPLVELPFPRGNTYLAYELIMDLAGVAILAGVSMAAVRRYILHPKTLETRWDDTFALVILGLIPIAGFTLEASRLLSAVPPWSAWSPVGNLVADMLAALGMTAAGAVVLHNVLFWVHMALGLTLVVAIPFTKLRHLIYVPLNVILKPQRKEGVLEKIENIDEAEILGVGQIEQFTPHQLLSFDACVRCGRCEEICPATQSGMSYSPKSFIQSMRQAMLSGLVNTNGNGKEAHELIGEVLPEETPWYCTTCGACLSICPAFVNPVEEVIDLRRYQVLTTGNMPKSVGEALRNIERQGNPWGMPAQDRVAWAQNLGVRELGPGDETDVLLFLGCASAFDDRNKGRPGLCKGSTKPAWISASWAGRGCAEKLQDAWATSTCSRCWPAEHCHLVSGEIQPDCRSPTLLQYLEK
jgi:heterodisulfide reductase subunit C/nitrate reductase gamma subunit